MGAGTVIFIFGIIAFIIWIIVKASRKKEPESWRDRERAIRAELKQQHAEDLQELKDEFRDSKKDIQQKSVSSSRRSLVGKFIEKFIPFLDKIKHQPSDMHFLGSPIDYISFDGAGDGEVDKITFIEVKTGNSKLTKREESIKRAVKNKRVFWEEVNIDTNGERPDIENKEK